VNPFRLIRWAGAGLITAVVVAFVPGTASSDTGSFVTGSGNAFAQFLRIGPTAARLSLAPTLGLSLSDYAGTVGRGQATDADLAAIGVAQPCIAADIPSLRVTSQDRNASQGQTTFFAGSRDSSGNGGGAGELSARATSAPYGESSFRLASFQIPGLIAVGEGFAHTSAGVIKGSVRQATATVEISSFEFAGIVKLGGLRWNVVQQTSDKGRRVSSTFTIQDGSVGGLPLSIPAGGSDLGSVLGPINAALAPTGFSIVPPVNDSLSGVASMSPLSVQIVNSPLGRQTLAPVLANVQQIREPLTNQLIPLFQSLAGPTSNSCGGLPSFPDLTVSILVADLGLGVASGSSDFHLELGGVNAYTEGTRYANPFLNALRNAPAASNGGVETVVKPGSPGTAGTPGTSGDTAQLTTALPPPAPKTVPGRKGGEAVAVGAIGLGAAFLLAAADWFRMRALQR
jgi:hypothetical protein